MNQIRSTIPEHWDKLSTLSFLLAFLLAGGSLLSVQARTHGRHVVKLKAKKARKLLARFSNPHYPVIARVNYVHGHVTLRIKVNRKGKVVAAHVLKGEPLLAASALKAIRKWRYKPYVSSKGPEGFETDVVLSFELSPFVIGRRLPLHPDVYLKKQIRPPEVLARPRAGHSHHEVKFKVLVSPKGKVLDALSESGKKSQVELALQNLQQWKFRPAYWGALPVPWYLTVKVPLERPEMDRPGDSNSH